MERELAELVVKSLREQKAPMITVLEAMSMTKIKTDNQDVYAFQKGDTTIMAWISRADGYYVRTATYCW